jgi:Mrp family chromosome partitioning ATPase
MLQKTAISNLLILATGPIPPNPADLFGSVRMQSLVAALEGMADIVVFDSPPVAISDSLLLSSLAGGIVFVTRAGKLRSSEIAQSIEAISQSGAPVLGVVLNAVRPKSQANYRVYQQYYPLASDREMDPVPKRRLGWLRGVFGRSA